MKTIRLFTIAVFFFFTISCDNPKQGTLEDKEAVKGDTLNPREGAGEGPIGEEAKKGG
jgi:hypothetical protein